MDEASNDHKGSDATLYDITREELSGCTLTGEFKMGGYLLDGDWKVTFMLED